jgi:hypothetical protein
MAANRCDGIARKVAVSLPRRSLLVNVGQFAAGAAGLGAGAGRSVNGMEARRKRRRCRPKAGKKSISVEAMVGPNRCTCEQSRQAVLAQIRDQFCTGENDPGCAGRANCDALEQCVIALVNESAPQGCTPGDPGDNPACSDTRGVVFDTSGAYNCTCGCRFVVCRQAPRRAGETEWCDRRHSTG